MIRLASNGTSSKYGDDIKVQFCPTCGTRLTRTSYELFCHHCGYKSEIHDDTHMEIINSTNNRIPNVEVLEGDILNLEILPSIDTICEECSHKIKAKTWAIPIGSGNSSSVTFFRCTFCGYTWREND
jgi:DNA-directed RNA polymerase subunit M